MKECERCGESLTTSDVPWQTGEWLCVGCKATWVSLMPREATPAVRAASGGLDDPDDAFAARLTERLRRAIDNGVRGGIAAYVAVHPVDGIDAGGLAKRITGQMWNTLKTHPDVRTRHGKFPDEIARQLEACRTECAEKSTLLAALRSRGSGGLDDLLSELRQHIQHRWTADPEKIEDWYERLATACASGS